LLLQLSQTTTPDTNPLDCNNFLIVFHNRDDFQEDALENRRKKLYFQGKRRFLPFFPRFRLAFSGSCVII